MAALDGKKLVDDNIDGLFKEIEGQNATTALDVQNYAPIAIGNHSTKGLFNKAKDYIYSHPTFKFTNSEGNDVEIPLDLNTLNTVLGLYLRDKFLETHPNIIPNLDENKTP